MSTLGRFLRYLGVCMPVLIGGTIARQVWAETVLHVAMTAGDVPITIGQPDQGFKGYRFVGSNLYDSLILRDLSCADVVADLRPGLATSWSVDPANPQRWIITLRKGVKFHDGCNFTAADVVWNFECVTKRRYNSLRSNLPYVRCTSGYPEAVAARSPQRLVVLSPPSLQPHVM